MKITIRILTLLLLHGVLLGQSGKHDLQFTALANQWDEAIPLGNGLLGALIWEKSGHLRFSLDRADLWDGRPMEGLHRKEFSYQWVVSQVMKKDYAPVQQYFDEPYDREPAPSRIPGGVLEVDTKSWGSAESVHLFLSNAACEVRWTNGTILKTFVQANSPVGWFRFEKLKTAFVPQLIAPEYQGEAKIAGGPVGGDALSRLGYSQGKIQQQGNRITYTQKVWGEAVYEITVRWKSIDSTTIEGVWSITLQHPGKKTNPTAAVLSKNALLSSYAEAFASHSRWWKNYWSKSAIHVPDSLLEKQWYLEQYKFGSASRRGAPPISLQAVWTADNGRLPPWKGDFHNDLNTQLSYWPCYSANHLEEGLSYLDHLDANKPNYRRYTKMYFGKEGLAVPGVTTLDGTEMGGWIQYSLSPTVSSWLAQHYYLQWRYGMDRTFLEKRAYPWIKAVATFIENITTKDENGHRKLPISSSPEINDNALSAWFTQNTNYDLALMKFTFKAAAELAGELNLKNDALHWNKLFLEFDDFSITANDQLMFSPTMAYDQSHRHFSHLMAIHPLGLLKWEDGAKAQSIIRNSIHLLDSLGPANWCGYSYAWLANLKARAKDGEGAAAALSIFAKAFCSINSFHLNGDQTKSGYSNYQYRPFTLEGNFAFAAGLQEMLLQSYAGFIELLPAVPTDWTELAYTNLRTEGAFLVSVKKTGGKVKEVKIISEKGGVTTLKLPFKTWRVSRNKEVQIVDSADGFIRLICKTGSVLVLNNSDN